MAEFLYWKKIGIVLEKKFIGKKQTVEKHFS